VSGRSVGHGESSPLGLDTDDSCGRAESRDARRRASGLCTATCTGESCESRGESSDGGDAAVVTVMLLGGKAGRSPPWLLGYTEPAWLAGTVEDRGARPSVGDDRGLRSWATAVPTKRDRPQAGSVRKMARGFMPSGSVCATSVRPHAGPKLRRRTSACRRGGCTHGVGSRRM